MTTANREHGSVDVRDAVISELADDAIRKFNRERRKRKQKIISRRAMAFEIFGRNDDWLAKRLLGQIPFTTAELLDLGDFLGVNILEWIETAKRTPGGPGALNKWALRGSNPQPTDYKVEGSVTDLAQYRYTHLRKTG